MGMFEDYANVHYPQLGEDLDRPCSFCGGKGFRVFPGVLTESHDPDEKWCDPCPAGCEQTVEFEGYVDARIRLIPEDELYTGPDHRVYLNVEEYQLVRADREHISARRDREIARIARWHDAWFYDKSLVRRGTRTKKPHPDAVWVGSEIGGYWTYPS